MIKKWMETRKNVYETKSRRISDLAVAEKPVEYKVKKVRK
jgi:hypothetical protein